MDLAGKTMVITGAGSGIGQATALKFAEAGVQVVCCGRREGRLQETVREIEAKGGTGFAVALDVTDLGQVENMVERVLEHFGDIDILFNCAGSFSTVGGLWEVDPDAWWRDVEVNLKGSMLCARAVLPHMIEKDSGIVINTGGGGAAGPMPGGSSYGSSKAAILRMTDTLGRELAQVGAPVLVVAVDPGFNRTEMTETLARLDPESKWIPMRQWLAERHDHVPEDCARTLVELVRLAVPEFNGRLFHVGQDIEALVAGKDKIVAGDLMTLRLRQDH